MVNNTDDYDNVIFSNSTKKRNIFDIFMPRILWTILCGLSVLCLMSLLI